jgi:putative lipoprotein
MRLLVFAAVLAACATTPEPPETALLSGELTYRERIALPPGSVARAFLRRDGAAVAEEVTVTSGEQVPLPFTLEVPRAAFAPEGDYTVSGTIERPDGEAMFESEGRHVTDGRYPPRDVGVIVLRRVMTGD